MSNGKRVLINKAEFSPAGNSTAILQINEQVTGTDLERICAGTSLFVLKAYPPANENLFELSIIVRKVVDVSQPAGKGEDDGQ